MRFAYLIVWQQSVRLDPSINYNTFNIVHITGLKAQTMESS